MSTPSVHFAHAPKKNNWYIWSGLAFLLFLVFSAVGLVIFQSTLEEPQDIRQQAMVADGQIELSFTPTDAAALTLGEEQAIDIKINTNGNQIDGVELIFNLIGPGFSSTPELVATNTSLPAQVQEVQQVTDGYLVSFKALVPPNSAFSSTQPTTFARLTITPSQAGQITLNFDVEKSLSTIRNANPVADELKTIDIISYTVADDTANPTPPISPSDSPIVGAHLSASCTQVTGWACDPDHPNTPLQLHIYKGPLTPGYPNYLGNLFADQPGDQSIVAACGDAGAHAFTWSVPASLLDGGTYPIHVFAIGIDGEGNPLIANSPITLNTASCIASASPDVSPSPAVDPSPGVGGTTSAQCNQTCSSNDDCPADHRCYDTGSSEGKRCRLVTNVSSTSCSNPPAAPLNRQCNEYCADARECAPGYACQNNKCRNPLNVESTSCLAPTSTQQQAITQSCNKACTANRDCAANMRCFYGTCRLASNPSSTSCSVASSKTVTSTTYQKGGSLDSKIDATKSGSATKSGNVRNQTGTQSAGIIKPSASPSPAASPMSNEDVESENKLVAFFPQILMGAGALLILIVLAFIISRFLKGNRRPPLPPEPVRSAEDKMYEQQLEDKINALRQETKPIESAPKLQAEPPVVSAAPTIAPAQPQFRPQPEPVKTPVVQPQPVAQPQFRPQPAAVTRPPVQPAPQPRPITQVVTQPAPTSTKMPETPIFDRTTPPSPTSSSPTHSSMLDRIRSKGITPPGNDQ